MTEPAHFAIYRLIYLLPGTSRWEVFKTEFTDKGEAIKVAQGLHDKYLMPDDTVRLRVLLLATPMQYVGQVPYDNGTSEPTLEEKGDTDSDTQVA